MASRLGTARSGPKKKEVPKSATEIKREKQMHDFQFNTEEAKVMRLEIRNMRAEIENETRLLNDFQQQKLKVDQFHELAKQQRDQLKMDLRNSLRQKADLEEKQAYELKIYKQKVKHLLHEQQGGMSDLRIEGEEKLMLQQQEQRASEHDYSTENRELKVTLKQAENAHWDFLKNMKLEQEKSILALRVEYERKNAELKAHYEKKQKTVRDECDDSRKEEVTRLELKKNSHIADLMSKHKRKFDKIKKYYSDITHANLELIKNLKEEVGDMKKKEQAVAKEVAEIRRINKRLSKPLQKNRKLVEELKASLARYKLDKQLLARIQAELKSLEDRIKNLEWEQEVSTQKLHAATEEKEAVEKKLAQTIYEVQQKSGFKNLLLEKKITAMTQDLEKTESALAEVLASTNLHPEIIGDIQHNLEDVLMSKNKATQKLEDQIEDAKRAYARTIQSYEAKLAEYQIPVEELGFTATRTL